MTSSTVDPKEILHFKEFSSFWWDKTKGPRLLHSMNQLRVPLVQNGLIELGVIKKDRVNSLQPLEDLLILDVGCGGGILSEALAKLGCTVVGIDLCAELIEVAKQHAALDPSLSNLNYLAESAEQHAVENFEKYDAVIASEVLEHIPDQGKFLEDCVKCLKPGGSMFITTINKTMTSWAIGIIFYEYIWGVITRGRHQWDKFVAPEKTRRMLKECNCTTKNVYGMIYNFLTKTWRWDTSTSIFYALHAIKG